MNVNLPIFDPEVSNGTASGTWNIIKSVMTIAYNFLDSVYIPIAHVRISFLDMFISIFVIGIFFMILSAFFRTSAGAGIGAAGGIIDGIRQDRMNNSDVEKKKRELNEWNFNKSYNRMLAEKARNK